MESAGSSGAVSGGRLRKSRRPSCPRRPVRLWYPLHPLIHSRTYPVNHRQNEIAPRTGYRVPAGFLNNYEKISSTACLLNRSPIKRLQASIRRYYLAEVVLLNYPNLTFLLLSKFNRNGGFSLLFFEIS